MISETARRCAKSIVVAQHTGTPGQGRSENDPFVGEEQPEEQPAFLPTSLRPTHPGSLR